MSPHVEIDPGIRTSAGFTAQQVVIEFVGFFKVSYRKCKVKWIDVAHDGFLIKFKFLFKIMDTYFINHMYMEFCEPKNLMLLPKIQFRMLLIELDSRLRGNDL